MKHHIPHALALTTTVVLMIFGPARGEKVLIYDEEKGIIFVEKDAQGKPVLPKTEKPKLNTDIKKPVSTPSPAPAIKPRKPVDKNDIHVDRKKDPPSIYFNSGLEYFKNGNYDFALKNFTFADSVDPRPEYALWIGKTYRQLGKPNKMLFVMKKILDTYPESDVADDALFETAFYYQSISDYETSMSVYAQLAEQYPFGRSYSTGEEFRESARKQRQAMHEEIIASLATLGYARSEDLSDMCGAFQKAEGIAANGLANQQTVQLVQQRLEERKQSIIRAQEHEKRMLRHTQIMSLIAVFFGLNLIVVLIAGSALRSRVRQIISLRQMLQELDTKKLSPSEMVDA